MYIFKHFTELVTRTRNENGHMFIRAVPSVESFIELAYYSNMLTPHFALSSILLTTFHALLPEPNLSDKDANQTVGVSQKKLIETALENCLVYRYEFILNKPTQVLEAMLFKQLEELLINGCLRRNEVIYILIYYISKDADNVYICRCKNQNILRRHVAWHVDWPMI